MKRKKNIAGAPYTDDTQETNKNVEQNTCDNNITTAKTSQVATVAPMHDHKPAQSFNEKQNRISGARTILENLPAELLNQKRFFPVRLEPDKNGKISKVPCVKAWQKPENQMTAQEAAFEHEKATGLVGMDICGHGLNPDYFFVDFDHVKDQSGNFLFDDAEHWNNYLELAETFSERSISKDGMHYLLNPTPNKFPELKGTNKTPAHAIYFDETKRGKDAPKIELFYGEGRYILLTGNLFGEPNKEILSGLAADDFCQQLCNQLALDISEIKDTADACAAAPIDSDISVEEVKKMLAVIPCAKVTYFDWFKTAAIIHYHFGEAGFELWRHWSETDPKRYTLEACQRQWGYIVKRSTLNIAKPAKIGSLILFAKQFGYKLPRKIAARADPQTTEIESDDEIFNEHLNVFQEQHGTIDPNILPKLKDTKIFIDGLTPQNFKPEYAFNAAIWSKVGLAKFYMPSISQKFFDVMKEARKLAKDILKKISSETDALKKSGEYIPDIDTTAITRLSELAPSKIEDEISSLVVTIKRKHKNFLADLQAKENEAARQATLDALKKNPCWTQNVISDCPLNLFLPETIFLTEKTIGTQNISENGTIQKRTAAKTPLIVTRILREPNTHTTQYEIQIKARHIWRKIIVDGDEIADTRKILRLAKDGGAIIKDPRALANFFAELISANEDRLNETKTYNQPGWHGNKYIYPIPDPTDDYICRRAGFNYEQEFATQGNALIWKATFLDACQKGGAKARIAFGNVFAAPLVRPLNVPNIQCQLDGKSGGGKTALLKFAASTFGNPRKLIRTFGATLKNRQAVAAAYNDLPTFLDELGTLQGGKKGADTLPQMVYEFEQGKMNQAQKRNGDARETFEFYGSRTMTGEFSILKSHDPRGTHKRVIPLDCGEKLFDDEFATELHITAENHFGHFGRQWTKYVESHLEAIRESYLGFTEYIYREKKVNIEPTQLKAITVDAVAYQHFRIAIGEQTTFDFVAAAKDIKAIISTLPTPDELDDSTRAIKDLQSYIAGHDKYFSRDIKNEYTNGAISVTPQPFESYGKKFDNGEVAFLPHALKNILEKELGYQSADALISEFARKGLLRCTKGRGYRYSTWLNGKSEPTIRFKANAFPKAPEHEEAEAVAN